MAFAIIFYVTVSLFDCKKYVEGLVWSDEPKNILILPGRGTIFFVTSEQDLNSDTYYVRKI